MTIPAWKSETSSSPTGSILGLRQCRIVKNSKFVGNNCGQPVQARECLSYCGHMNRGMITHGISCQVSAPTVDMSVLVVRQTQWLSLTLLHRTLSASLVSTSTV